MSNFDQNGHHSAGDHGNHDPHQQHQTVTIIVNGEKKTLHENHLSFAQLVHLAFPKAEPNAAFTATYDKGPKENHEGSMSPGDSVKLKNGMVFNVTPTNKS